MVAKIILFFKKAIENFANQIILHNFAPLKRKVGRVIECAGLEIRYTHYGYRGFESLTFRQEQGGSHENWLPPFVVANEL